MKRSNKEEIKQLIKKNKTESEMKVQSSSSILRIDLKPENLRLWRETYASYQQSFNLLLACEDSKCALNETNLTWVVGAAIRPALATSKKQAKDILKSIGVDNDLISLVSLHCPGFGEEITWAFYLERHGLLSTSPIVNHQDSSLQ